MISAVIFDMDGTMVNTQHLWKDVNNKLAEMHGKTFDDSMRIYMMGRKELEALAIFKEYYQIPVTVEELAIERKKLLFEDLRMVQINKGLTELLDLLDTLSIKKAVATSAMKDFTTKILTQFNLKDRFDVIITGDEVQKGKPDPTIFLEAAKKLSVNPKDCLVLEDAQIGVEAASKAGMKVFAIPHDFSNHHDFSLATKVLPTMLDITADMLQLLGS